MATNRFLQRLPLKARLIGSYLVILGVGGLATSVVGSWIVSSTIMMQARRAVQHNLATARAVYQQQLSDLERTLRLAAFGTTIEQHLSARDRPTLLAYLNRVRADNQLDFLTLADPDGRVLLRSTGPDRTGDDVSSYSIVRTALDGGVAASTEIMSADQLAREDPHLQERAHLRLVPTARAQPIAKQEESSGLVLMGAAPVRDAAGEGLGVLYGGVLVNRNFGMVDHVWDILYKGERYRGKDVGTVTIFLGDVRVSTNVKLATGERALGTLVSQEVRAAVLERGEMWEDRAFVVNDWYISAYEPIRNYSGAVVGILYVGQLEKLYTSTRDRVIFLFFAIATVGFVLILVITYYMIKNITRPIGEMVEATRDIAAGHLDREIHPTSQGELAQLAESFNLMLKSLRQMKADLEEWGRTLEEKVRERTEELVAMQTRVAQSERLASLGMLAAGVAHEINNPLGGILSLTALALEDISAGDPNRKNLEEVVRQSERCREIVRGLLEFSRQSETGTERVDINETIENTLDLVGKQSAFFNVRLVRDLAPSLPPVTAERSQLQQVLMNIIINAVQAMAERGTLTVSTRETADASVEIRISDTGRGIPADEIDRIFDPFYTTKESGEGTGLGLSIAYGIVTKHGGTITVDSVVGEGTMFTVSLPLTGPFAELATR
ncbi:MAG: cache domain-containing protein [Gemmatimonadales bacterium]|jgi:two-component system NtrC family sensor kinase